MEKLVLGVLALLVVLVAISYGVWRFAKNLRIAKKFRICLIGIVALIAVAICVSFFIESCTDGKDTDTNNKEEIIIKL